MDYYGGAGCQHIAFRTNNIIEAVESLTQRGVSFLSVPSNYYVNMRERLAMKNVKIAEDITLLQKYNILIDFDEGDIFYRSLRSTWVTVLLSSWKLFRERILMGLELETLRVCLKLLRGNRHCAEICDYICYLLC